MSDDNTTRREFLKATGSVATVAALAGCAGGPGATATPTESPTETPTEMKADETPTETEAGTPTATDTPERKWDPSKTVRAVSGTMDTLDPIKSTDTASGGKVQNIFDALTNYKNGTTNVEMLLAKDFTSKQQGKVLEFQLKEGVQFSDGSELTAQDFVYSFERLAASKNSRRSGFILNDLAVKHETHTVTTTATATKTEYKPGSLAVEAVDDYTLRIELEKPFPATLSLLAYSAFSAVPEGIVGDIQGYAGQMSYKQFATEKPIGTGPYTLKSWEPKSSMQLEAKDEWHGGEIRNSAIDYRVLSQSNAIYTYATVNVNADSPFIPNSKFKPKLRNIEGTDERGRRYGTYGPFEPNGMTADYVEIPTLSSFYTAFDCKDVPEPVRKAFAYAFSQKEFAQRLHSGPEKEAYFFTPPAIFPGGGARYNELAKDYPYGYQTAQLNKAKQVMEDAGYSSSNQFELTLAEPAFTASTWGKDYFNLMRDKLTTAHVKLSLTTAKWSTFLTQARQGKYQSYFLGWIADWPNPDNFLKLLYPPKTRTPVSKYNSSSYMNWYPGVGNGVDHAQEAIDAWKKYQNNRAPTQEAKQARGEAYVAIEKANWKDMVMMPMYHGISQDYDYKWVHGPRTGAMGGSRAKSNTIGIGDRGKWE